MVHFLLRFVKPVMKLLTETKHETIVHKGYEKARTPYQRLLQSGVFNDTKKADLMATYFGLNPLLFLKNINNNLEHMKTG